MMRTIGTTYSSDEYN